MQSFAPNDKFLDKIAFLRRAKRLFGENHLAARQSRAKTDTIAVEAGFNSKIQTI